MLKLSLSILFFLCMSSLPAQNFKKDIDYNYKGDLSFSLASAFEHPKKVGKLDIDIDELKKMKNYSIERLANLEVLEIKITENPETEDKIKLQRIKSAEKIIEELIHFKKAPKLKYVVFGIGEGLFLMKKDKKNKPTVTHNLHLAYLSLGEKTEKILSGVTVLAYNWEW